MTRMKDIANSHKVFKQEKENIHIANFSNMHSIMNSLSGYFEHNSEHIKDEQASKEIEPIESILPDIENKIPKIIAPPVKQNQSEITKIIDKDETSSSMVLYNSLTNAIYSIKEKILNNEPFDLNKILPLIPKLVKATFKNSEILTIALNPGRSTEWFASHSVNTTIIAIKISNGLQYNNNKMYALALSTLLHDVGMLKINPDILNNPGQLNPIQKNKIKSHPQYGVNIVNHLSAKYPFLAKTIYEEHEKWDGSGYPNRLKGEQISPFARVISLSDKFESLVHERNYRPAYKPPLAIQKIMNENHEAYEPKVLKAFINEISMYPVGSYVLLNTGEVAQVMSVNKNRPVRPMVRILTKKDGKSTDTAEELNLEKEPLTYITKTVSYIH